MIGVPSPASRSAKRRRRRGTACARRPSGALAELARDGDELCHRRIGGSRTGAVAKSRAASSRRGRRRRGRGRRGQRGSCAPEQSRRHSCRLAATPRPRRLPPDGLPRAVGRALRLADALAQVLVGDLPVADRAGRPQLDVLVAVARLRRAALHLGRHRAGREPPSPEQEAGVRDHAVVGPHGEALDVPAADHRLARVGLGEQPGAADVLRDAAELRRRGDVAEHDSAGGERVGDDVDALPRSEHVEDDPVDGCRRHCVRQLPRRGRRRRPPSSRALAEEGLDVRARDVGELRRGARRRRGAPRAPIGAQQPERQRARADARLDDDRAGEDVGLGEDLRGILRVDDRGAARHRHDEVAQQRAQREVLVAGAVGDDRAVGLADEGGVLQHAVVGVQLAVLAEGDGVQAALGPGQLHAVADAERSAGSLSVIGRSPRL